MFYHFKSGGTNTVCVPTSHFAISRSHISQWSSMWNYFSNRIFSVTKFSPAPPNRQFLSPPIQATPIICLCNHPSFYLALQNFTQPHFLGVNAILEALYTTY